MPPPGEGVIVSIAGEHENLQRGRSPRIDTRYGVTHNARNEYRIRYV
jgi:hypothetical protein